MACRNRRASRCAPCAEVYRADTYQLIRAGLAGGKNVPDTVAGHPRVFATLTAPSFGAVHHRVVNPDGTVQRCHPGAGCNQRHAADDPCLGQAVDPDTLRLHRGGHLERPGRRPLASHHHPHRPPPGPTARRDRRASFAVSARLSYGKVAEFQARGLVHFHVIVRLDGPDGPDQPPPEGLTVEVLTAAIEAAARQAVVTSPDSPATGGPATGALGRAARHPTHHRRRRRRRRTHRPEGGRLRGQVRHQGGREHRHPGPARGVLALQRHRPRPRRRLACAKAATVGPPATTTSTTWSTTRTPRP